MRRFCRGMPYRWYQANRDSIQRSCQTSSAGRPSIVSSGLTKNSISICSNSRVRKMKLPGVISLRKALPIWAIPNGSFSRIDCSTLRSEEHTSELQSHHDLVCRLLLEKKKNINTEPC